MEESAASEPGETMESASAAISANIDPNRDSVIVKRRVRFGIRGSKPSAIVLMVATPRLRFLISWPSSALPAVRFLDGIIVVMASENHLLRAFCIASALVLGSALPAGCVVYEPVPASYGSPSTYDRAWNAALGALQDVGVQVTSADAATGAVRGTRNGIDVAVSVVRQADGRTRVQFDAKGSEREPGLADRFSEAYERRMGR
jgi:hypothetical protein